jgi:hypothetical protein
MGPPALPVHPVATLYPVPFDDELQDLADDIAANGLRQIVLDHDGVLKRAPACRAAGDGNRGSRSSLWQTTGGA